MFFDPLYLLVIAVSGGLSLYASLRVRGAFARWKAVPSSAGQTGAEVARGILRASGIRDVTVEPVGGLLSDHYDPRTRTLRLSPDVFHGTSVAAAGVAAHEVGHALQHAEGYKPLKVRSFLAPAAALGSNLAMIVFALGLAVGALGLAKLGVVLFGLMVAFTLVTLPVEFDASRRARALLFAGGRHAARDADGVSAVLNAAALTYVAAAIGAIMTLVYMLLRSGLFGGRDE
jgi:Zn-dependent membrane protease YugP